jgi:hypothetical protein
MQFLKLKEHYLKVLHLYHSWHIYHLPNGTYFDGKIIGTAENGQLLVEDIEANVLKFANKEIIF